MPSRFLNWSCCQTGDSSGCHYNDNIEDLSKTARKNCLHYKIMSYSLFIFTDIPLPIFGIAPYTGKLKVALKVLNLMEVKPQNSNGAS